ncbi:MAG: hypothetical protein WC683_02805 [bacterium]
MKLTEAELEEGRALVRAGNIVALESWVDRRGILVNKEVLRDTMFRAMRNEPMLAIRLFDRVFEGMDPELDRRVTRRSLGILAAVCLFVATGLLGGIVYLVRAMFW